MKNKNAKAALKILRIATENDDNILSKEEEQLKEMALKELKSHETDFLLVREQIKAWEKVVLRQKDKEKGDTFLFSVMVELVKQFGTKDPEWNCVIEQFINTLFAVKQLKSYKKVELLLHSLMKKLSSEQDNIIEQIENEIRDREEIDIDETLFD